MAVQVPGIYVALESGLAIGVAGLVNRTDWAVHILFPNGDYRYDWPDQGLIGDFGVDRARNPSFWGRWRYEDRVEIERPGASVRFTAEPDALVGESGERFARLPDDADDIDLTGQWLREASVSDKPRIEFIEGDRFETSGGLLGLIVEPHFVADWGPLQGRSLFDWPDDGGSYERGLHTLVLRRDDGAVVHMLALASKERMRLGYTRFARAG